MDTNKTAQIETKSETIARRTYWLQHPRGFANEYTVGIATTKEDAEQYAAEDFKRIDRDHALSLLSRRAGNGETLSVGVIIDGEPDQEGRDRLQIARAFRKGAT